MTATITPDRSIEQRMTALKRANEIRSKRAALKRDLKARRADLIPLLVDPPEWLRSTKVTALLLACPALGPVKTNVALKTCGLSASKTVAGLSERQRAALITHLRAGRPAVPSGIVRARLGNQPDAQHMQALARSTDIRLGRATIKRQVFAGERTVEGVLREMPACVESMTLFDLLDSQYLWGADRTRRLLGRLGVPETKALGTLTQRQVGLVVDALGGKS